MPAALRPLSDHCAVEKHKCSGKTYLQYVLLALAHQHTFYRLLVPTLNTAGRINGAITAKLVEFCMIASLLSQQKSAELSGVRECMGQCRQNLRS